MFWRKKPPKYEIQVPPLDKPFDQLTRAEAQAFFDWYTGQLEARTAYLRQYTGLKLDHSPESLVRLWKWFLRHAQIEDTPPERLDSLKQQLSSSPLVETVLQEQARQFTLETECVIWDIGMYWGQTFVLNHPSIYWGFYSAPKRDLFVNRPLLLGFPNEVFPEKEGPPFEPVHMTHVQASRLLRSEASGYDLLNVHMVWADKIPSSDQDA